MTEPARGLADDSQPFRDDSLARFAPADNLYDAIRADVASIGGVEFQPLLRTYEREFPFNDIDWNPFDDE
ncbi:MAG TPA: hypothetical protein VGB91_09270 [Rhizomicrobium sp.]